MQIVMKSNQPPSVVFRCWLFVAMSLMQQGQLKESKRIIETVYCTSKSLDDTHRDQKIEKMCLGIWARLKFVWSQRKTAS